MPLESFKSVLCNLRAVDHFVHSHLVHVALVVACRLLLTRLAMESNIDLMIDFIKLLFPKSAC